MKIAKWTIIMILTSMFAACGGGGGASSAGGGGNSGDNPPSNSLGGAVTFNGQPVPGATIVAIDTNTNSVFGTAVTDASGNYAFAGLGASCTDQCIQTYDILAFKAGYAFNAVMANNPSGNRSALVWGDGWNNTVFGWGLPGAGAASVRAGINGAFTNPNGGAPINFNTIEFNSLPNGSVTGANFIAYNGSNPLIQLAATGQQTSYAAGDDGALRAGVAWPNQRFSDNGDGTVLDRLTGLVWLKNAGCFTPTLWAAALTDINQLASGQCGLSDGSKAGTWRLPNVLELESVIDITTSNPALSGPFSNVSNGLYWTSTAYWGGDEGTIAAWTIQMSDGSYINDQLQNLMASSNNGVWAVKGTSGMTVTLPASGAYVPFKPGDDGTLEVGPSLPTPRMVDNGNGTVTDSLTGLVWLKAASCINDTWQGALADVANLASGQCGLTDGSVAGKWHMPNRREMQSLQDRGQNNHADYFDENFTSGYTGVPNQNAVFNTMTGFQFYWTSSTDAADTTQAWTTFSCDYGVYPQSKSNKNYTLAVRNP
jgi:hypothetical protein